MESGTVNQSVGAFIHATSTNRYLFLLRTGDKFDNTWGLVGGKLEKGENVSAGLAREIQEELGGTIKDAKLIPIEQYTSNNNRFVYHTFMINVDDEFIPILNEEHKGYCWVPLEQYPKPLHPGVYRTVKFESIFKKIKTLEKVK